MARIRAVDPYASRRYRPATTGPTPDPNAESFEPGELARRVAAAMSARYGEIPEPTSEELLERIEAAIAEEAAESPGEAPGGEAPDTTSEAHTDAQGGDGGDPVGWPTAVQAAEVLNVDPAEVRRRCREGELEARKDLTGAWRINPASLGAA